MTPERLSARLGRALLQLSILALGLATIVGSGGGIGALGFPDTSCLNTPQGCGTSTATPTPALPYASLKPQRPIVQVGMPLSFSVSTDVISPTYRWCWFLKGNATCAEVVGASGSSYTLPAANLAYDGSVLQVNVTGSNGPAVGLASVAVSSMPALTYTDTEFIERDWSAVAVANPPLAGMLFSAKRVDSGGNPGAYRLLAVDLPLEVRTVNLLGSTAAAVYDPATQGAVYLIEFSLDCSIIAVAKDPSYSNYWLPVLEQGGRRFIPDRNSGASCLSPGWSTRSWNGFDAASFKVVDGPVCGAGEICPNFSSQGLPMRLGLAYNVEVRTPLPAAGAASTPHFEQGLDNFKVTVWRR